MLDSAAVLASLLVGLTFLTGFVVSGVLLHRRRPRRADVPLLRVTRAHGTFVHLAADGRRTLCGLDWQAPADDGAEVDAFLASLCRPAATATATCPLCAAEARDHLVNTFT